jgi:hypothetical protein
MYVWVEVNMTLCFEQNNDKGFRFCGILALCLG